MTGMFCPRCRCEYRLGFTECADCHVPLVDQMPPPDPPVRLSPEESRWEGNRSDSLDIAFIRGALVGYACCLALESVLSTGFTWLDLFPHQSGVSAFPLAYWLRTAEHLVQLIPSIGILLGGYIGRARRR